MSKKQSINRFSRASKKDEILRAVETLGLLAVFRKEDYELDRGYAAKHRDEIEGIIIVEDFCRDRIMSVIIEKD